MSAPPITCVSRGRLSFPSVSKSCTPLLDAAAWLVAATAAAAAPHSCRQRGCPALLPHPLIHACCKLLSVPATTPVQLQEAWHQKPHPSQHSDSVLHLGYSNTGRDPLLRSILSHLSPDLFPPCEPPDARRPTCLPQVGLRVGAWRYTHVIIAKRLLLRLQPRIQGTTCSLLDRLSFRIAMTQTSHTVCSHRTAQLP